ncbi:uncharacterized protein LOC110724097 [Chenopodium quinoa]|uniref:uncharacterized protein LOC110724097 n=1 Tax=Chenopodium quinoa TaxID=63459 RepID=UPI000B782D49|nr:uncharacterized protein LOC110724097 [Chenopodium quinoa]
MDFSMISGLRFTDRAVAQMSDLSWGAAEFRRGASCQSSFSDVLEEQRRSRSRSRHRGLDEEELGRGRRSLAVNRHSQSQREPQITQAFQETQWQPQSSQRFQGQIQGQRQSFSQPSQPDFRPVLTPVDPSLFSAPSSGIPPPVSGLFSVRMCGTMPPPTIPVSLSQSTPFASWTGPALSLIAAGVTWTSRDTTPRTRMMAGLFGSPFPYTEGGDDTDPNSSSSADF